MPSIRTLCWASTILVTAAFAQVLPHQRVQVGNYQLFYCDHDNHAERLTTYLEHLRGNLEKVISDVDLGVGSPHGYSAFFKGNKNKARVKRLFRNISLGKPILVLPNKGRGIYTATYRLPTIVCVRKGIPAIAGLVKVCKENVQGATVGAAFEANSELMLLCPQFWVLEEEPHGRECPTLDSTLTPNTGSLADRFQQSQLVHELAHMYGADGGTPGAWVDGEVETYRVNDAVNLDEAHSLTNAQTYALYYSCKFFTHLILQI